jgi:uncharacterized membrane protein YtjA (UPF0391 family)
MTNWRFLSNYAGYSSSTPFGVGKILFLFTVGLIAPNGVTYGYVSSTPFGVGKILFLFTVGFTYGYVSSTPFGVGKILFLFTVGSKIKWLLKRNFRQLSLSLSATAICDSHL